LINPHFMAGANAGCLNVK